MTVLQSSSQFFRHHVDLLGHIVGVDECHEVAGEGHGEADEGSQLSVVCLTHLDQSEISIYISTDQSEISIGIM